MNKKPEYVYVTKNGILYNFPASAWDRMDDTLKQGYFPQEPAPLPDVVKLAMGESKPHTDDVLHEKLEDPAGRTVVQVTLPSDGLSTFLAEIKTGDPLPAQYPTASEAQPDSITPDKSKRPYKKKA
jgi:hypothetical protein